jgi:hypothetical protein
MPEATDALLLVMMTPPPGAEEEFNAWADSEHIPERKRVPGFRSALRFRNTKPSPAYLALYDLADLSVLRSEPYLAIAGDNLSSWSKRILAGASAHWRFAGRRVGPVTTGPATGELAAVSQLVVVAWRGVPQRQDETVYASLQAGLGDTPGVVQTRLFLAESAGQCDYLGLVEAAQSLPEGLIGPDRFSIGSQSSDIVHSFTPVAAADPDKGRGEGGRSP